MVTLAAIAMVSAIPHYVTGQWPWTHPLDVASIQVLQNLKQQSLSLPGWQTLTHKTIKIGGNDWSYQELQSQDTPDQPTAAASQIAILLRPQPWRTNQPEVEWLDIAGSQNWQVDSRRQFQFTIDPVASMKQKPVQVKARFLRGWNQQQTYAVVQWYAWPGGGGPSPSQWFWADQNRQWRSRQRLPWIAVSILIPIEPVGDVRPYQPFAIALSQAVQTVLISGPLAANLN